MAGGSSPVRATTCRLDSNIKLELNLLHFIVTSCTELGSILHFNFFYLLLHDRGHIAVFWIFYFDNFLSRTAWRNHYCLNSFIRFFFFLVSLFADWFFLRNRNLFWRFVRKGDITNVVILVPLPGGWFFKGKFILAILNVARLIDWSHAAIKALLKICHLIIIM